MAKNTNRDLYRPGVGIVILNKHGDRVWIGKITEHYAWQFPQGGIENNETPKQAMFRELYEETGLREDQVQIIAESKKWYVYKFPADVNAAPPYIGQRQKWFLVQLKDAQAEFNLNISAEFIEWDWVTYWYPIRNIVYFKEDLYRKMLKEFAKFVFGKQSQNLLKGR